MKKIALYLFFFTILSVYPSNGQIDSIDKNLSKTDSLRKNFTLFGSSDLLDVTIRMNLTSYIRKSLKESSQDAEISIHLSDSDSMNLNTKVKYRGRFRFDNCGFPPMSVSFKKHLHADSDTDKIKKIKLVTHCDAGTTSDEYVLREYLVYKLFNILSDTSYRVRLLRITYIDTERKKKTITQYGFFIEPNNILANRLRATEVKIKNLTQRYIQPDVMDKISIFNYMVANWDWNIPNLQNVTVFKPYYVAGAGSGIAVPYDFDLSGIVNPDYAVLPEEYGLKSSRDRIFLGICRTKMAFMRDLQYFARKKKEMYDTINSFSYLNQRAKKDITNLLDSFFFQLEKERSLEYLLNYFSDSCKQL
jgi:hypothetical protein